MVTKNLHGLEIKLLTFLVKENIIKEDTYTSKEKRYDIFLEIDKKYHKLLEEILEGQKSTNNTLIGIVDNFTSVS